MPTNQAKVVSGCNKIAKSKIQYDQKHDNHTKYVYWLISTVYFRTKLVRYIRVVMMVPETSNSFLSNIILQIANEQKIEIVQVGSCDGKINDPIYELIRYQIKASSVMLIEPQASLIPILQENYEFHPEVFFAPFAVGPAKELELYRLKEKYGSVFNRTYLLDSPLYRVPSGFVSYSYEHVKRHIEGKLPEQILPNEAIEQFIVPCKPLREILSYFNFRKVDLLFVDCEGFDDEVIYNSSIELFKPLCIHFESVHLDAKRKFSLYTFLLNLGYTLFEYSEFDGLALRSDKFEKLKRYNYFQEVKNVQI